MAYSGFAKFFGNSRSDESTTNHRKHTVHEPSPQYAEFSEDLMTSNEHLSERHSEVLVIAVMGPTGSGKSTLISKLAGSTVKIGHNLSSCKCPLQSRTTVPDSELSLPRHRRSPGGSLQNW